MNLDDVPLPWDHRTIECLNEITAFHAVCEYSNLVQVDLQFADQSSIRPFEYQDISYIRCLSHTFTVRHINYAGVYLSGVHTCLFMASRSPVQLDSSHIEIGQRKYTTAYQYREKTNRTIELWLLSGQTWHWVRQPMMDRLQMVMLSLNDLARYVVTFEPDASSGEAKDVRLEWINR